MKLRQYQKQVVDEIKNENVIVKMPTGSGKTFVAAEFVLRGLKKLQAKGCGESNNEPRAALFLVPNRDLVPQQKKALEEWIGNYAVAEYHGSRAIPESNFDVLVSTPQAFLVREYDLVSLFNVVESHIPIILPIPDTSAIGN